MNRVKEQPVPEAYLRVPPSEVKRAKTYARFVQFFTTAGEDSAWCRGFRLAFLDNDEDFLAASLKLAEADSDTTAAALAYIDCHGPLPLVVVEKRRPHVHF